jgi:hypothetical protein
VEYRKSLNTPCELQGYVARPRLQQYLDTHLPQQRLDVRLTCFELCDP